MRWGPNFGATTPTPPTGIALEVMISMITKGDDDINYL